MRLRLLAFALAGTLAAGCASGDGDASTQVAASADAAPTTTGDAAAPPPPLEPPPMAVEPPPLRMPGTPGPGQVEPQCDADAAQAYVGREATGEVVEAARQAAGAQVVRTLSPGQMVTMEYHFSRLNLDVDDDNVIIGARCG